MPDMPREVQEAYERAIQKLPNFRMSIVSHAKQTCAQFEGSPTH